MIDDRTAATLEDRYAGQHTLFFDGACTLCSREMKLLSKKRHDLQLVDIHKMDLPPGGAKTELLKYLHYLTPEGTWMTGLDANVAAWSTTLLGHFLKLSRLPLLRFFSDKLYTLWATSRFNKRYVCTQNSAKCS